jgi:hypothetical protein
MTDTEQITIETYAPGTSTPELLATETITVSIPPDVIEQRAYTTALAAELVAYKADNEALRAACQAAVDIIPNNAFTGASQLKTALREIIDQSRAQRRMFRAAIRDVSALDDGQ